MDSPGVAEGVTTSMGDLSVEATPSSSVTGIAKYGNGGDAAGEDDDIWDDASDSPGHTSNLDREWIHRQNQFQKMGYRDGITEGQKDSAQEGFNVGFRQSVNVGYKRGLVRGVTSALSSLPGSLKEKLVPDSQCRSKLQDVHSSAQEISADESLQMFHESICRVIILQRNIKVSGVGMRFMNKFMLTSNCNHYASTFSRFITQAGRCFSMLIAIPLVAETENSLHGLCLSFGCYL